MPRPGTEWLAAITTVAITNRHVMTPGFAAAIERLAGRGPLLVQVREKDLDGRTLLELVRTARRIGVRVAVNDRLDVALAAGVDAVHLPERGLAVATARALAAALGRPDLVVGVSLHDPARVAGAVADGADLVQLGPIWSTPGPKAPPLGVEALRGLRDHGAHVVAVGGIETAEQRSLALAAGAHATAAIRASWSPDERGD